MAEPSTEIINCGELSLPVLRSPGTETYLALQPPGAQPYVVAPADQPLAEVGQFVAERQGVLRELQSEMLKHFRKTNSLKCRFHSGDVAHILGRPFMLRSYPLSATKKSQRGTRGRANVLARMQSDISVIELFVAQANNYDQGKAAFFSLAESIFGRNIPSLLQQCLPRVFPQVQLPANVNYRPMRDTWVRIDQEHDAVWFSESLIPYTGDAVVYAFLTEAIKCYAPEADAATRQQLLQAGLPNWSAQRDLLADPQSPYAF